MRHATIILESVQAGVFRWNRSVIHRFHEVHRYMEFIYKAFTAISIILRWRTVTFISLFTVAHSLCAEVVNEPIVYPVINFNKTMRLYVDAREPFGTVDKRIFGSNLEWFNNGGGLVDADVQGLSSSLVSLVGQQGNTVYRFPGGTLSDYYDWRNGTGPFDLRPTTAHPTDSGSSTHYFGSPELFTFLKSTSGEGMITVNAGTGTADLAANWVAYANLPEHAERAADGHVEPMGIKLWEVGNELYLPPNPYEMPINVEPEVYADRFIEFADAMRAVDPSIELLAIAEAVSNNGTVRGEHEDWAEVLLQRAADKIDYIALHNAYFPNLHFVSGPAVKEVYPRLWATPEAINRSLDEISLLIEQYEGQRNIGIAVTEWGTLFSLPFKDEEWFDHSKTLGAGVYIGRVLQVFMSHPRVKIANHFKLVDRSFLGTVSYKGVPKVPFWVLKLYSQYSGDRLLRAHVDSPTYDTTEFSVMQAEYDVADITTIATLDSKTGKVFVNLINRSLTNLYKIKLDIDGFKAKSKGFYYSISGPEPTSHNGRDLPPEVVYASYMEPYSSVAEGSIIIEETNWTTSEPIALRPFSIMTLVLEPR